MTDGQSATVTFDLLLFEWYAETACHQEPLNKMWTLCDFLQL